jgi:hypothetical protein
LGGRKTTYEAHEHDIFFSLLLLPFSRINIPLSLLFMNIPHVFVKRANFYSISADYT